MCNPQDLATSPLMLSVMTLAYRGVAIQELPQANTLARCEHLFDTYIEKMFQRRVGKSLYSKQKKTVVNLVGKTDGRTVTNSFFN